MGRFNTLLSRLRFVTRITRPWLAVAVVFVFLSPLVDVIFGMPLPRFILSLLPDVLLIDAKAPSGAISLRYKLEHVLSWFLIVTFALIVVSGRMSWYLWRVGGESLESEKLVALRTQFRSNLEAVTKVWNGLYPHAERPVFRYEAVRITHTISKNGDCFVCKEYEVRAEKEPIHMVPRYLLDSGDDVDFDALTVKVEKLDGQADVAFLPCEDTPTRKGVMVFFLPRILPTEARPRGYRITYHWPRYWRNLLERGDDVLWERVPSSHDIPNLTVEVCLQRDVPPLECEIITPVLGAGQSTLVGPTEDRKGLRVYQWKVTNGPPGEYRLRFTRTAMPR